MPSPWRPRAVLFDFDGTLADSFPAITASVNHVRHLYGLPPLALEEVCHYVGWGADHLMRKTIPNGDPVADLEAYRTHHPSVLASGTRLLPGALELLQALHQAGLPMGITSNKPSKFTLELVGILGVNPFFRTVLGPEDVARPKPAPDMLLAALERLGVAPADALYIGDMTVDIATGQGAGVIVWAVGTGTQSRATLEAAGPQAYFPDLDAIHRRLATDRVE